MPSDGQNPICYFAKTNFPESRNPFGILLKDRLHHFYILGKTGTGKTTMLQRKISQDISQGRVIRLKQIKAELEKLSARLISMEEKFLDDLIDASTYNSMKRRTQEKTHELLAEKKGIENLKKDIEEYLKLGISFLQGVDVFYANASVDMKKKIISSIFPKKLIFLRKSYRTFFLDELISLILSKHRPLKLLKIKTPRQNDGESNNAPLLRLELRTL